MSGLTPWIKRICGLLIAAQLGGAGAEVIAVPPATPGAYAATEPTLTFLFRADAAAATLIFIPGGEGRVGLKADWTEEHRYFSSYYFNLALRRLGDPRQSSGRFHVVIFDSPADLPVVNHWSPLRAGNEHLTRVEDVVKHYRDLLGKPVWLMGHSMGSISVTELYKRLQDKHNENLVAGLIVSGGENGTSLNYATTRLPVLLVHHAQDECAGNTPDHARRLYEKLNEAGNRVAELTLITAGSRSPDSKNPCRSGYHMYYGAGPELTQALDQFMSKHLERLQP